MSSRNYIFSPDKWTTLQPNLEVKNWDDLNLNSNTNMYIQFDILITSYYSNWRNIFHFTNNNQSSSRVPAMWVAPNGTYLSVCNSTIDEPDAWVATPNLSLNTKTNVVILLFENTVKIYFNAVLKSTQSIPGSLIKANSDTILYISDPWYPTNGGVQIKNLKFGNLPDNIKCSKDKICVGFEPDNRAYCYGSDAACLWGQNSCNTDSDCREKYNIQSPKYDGGGVDYCSPPLNTLSTSWPTGACPDVYDTANNQCDAQMSNTELQCYQNNYPDLKGLTRSELQEQWSTKGCSENRNNKCPSYQDSAGTYQYIGCYNDMCYNGGDGPRALPNYRGLVSSIDDCATIAYSNKETLFGVQCASCHGGYHGECWTGSNVESAKQYGENFNKDKCAPLGGYCTQQIYQKSDPFPPPPQSKPYLTDADFANKIENFENNNNYIYNRSNKLIIIIILILIVIILYFINF